MAKMLFAGWFVTMALFGAMLVRVASL